jgi:hypothetical protein
VTILDHVGSIWRNGLLGWWRYRRTERVIRRIVAKMRQADDMRRWS